MNRVEFDLQFNAYMDAFQKKIPAPIQNTYFKAAMDLSSSAFRDLLEKFKMNRTSFPKPVDFQREVQKLKSKKTRAQFAPDIPMCTHCAGTGVRFLVGVGSESKDEILIRCDCPVGETLSTLTERLPRWHAGFTKIFRPMEFPVSRFRPNGRPQIEIQRWWQGFLKQSAEEWKLYV